MVTSHEELTLVAGFATADGCELSLFVCYVVLGAGLCSYTFMCFW